ncbi:multiple epidermal growth factor-like domains protein 10 isoform X2 [Ostrea edulis]|uniref:multiple epidermal growth factor-like domains protein 10 isoform X2 n=1 Tax=Ostrea edulis TaxID=37623 RepID=UPI0024AEEF52|nr:multiple epidermal growth factor-like domains protein 10 isoform X2 [Ostrea edulis]
MKMWRKWIVFFTVCQNTLCIEQPYQLVDVNTRCFEIKVESRLNCNNESLFYHCLLDENYTKEYEVCREWKWISEGKCAYFNPYGRGNVDERNCAGNSTKKCATEVYRSDLNMQYDACYVKKRIAITIPIVPVTVRPRICGIGYILHNNRCTECEAGTRGINCSKTCPDGYYGRLCQLVCPTDCKGTCNKVKGSCPECEAGTRGINCSETCPDGYYGRLCQEVCPTDCKGICNKVNGSCPDEDDSHVSVEIDRPHSTHESVTCRYTVIWRGRLCFHGN